MEQCFPPLLKPSGIEEYETDIGPEPDQVSVLVVALYLLNDEAKEEIARKLPGFQEAALLNLAIIQFGDKTYALMERPTLAYSQALLDVVMKFWLSTQNLDKEKSEIFRIEIPTSLDGIICRVVTKQSGMYPLVNKIFEG